MGVRRRGSAPTFYRPDQVYFRAGLLLCVCFGITLGGIHDSIKTQDWAWVWIFVGAETCCAGLYFWIVWSWTIWMTRSGDFSGANEAVDCLREDHDHSGEC